MTASLTAALRTSWQRPTGRLGYLILAVLVLIAILLPPFLPNPTALHDLLAEALQPPSRLHPFGTDPLSRDVLARTIGGLRVSLGLGVLSVLLAVTVGCIVGLAAAVLGGAADTLIMRGVDALLSIPRLFVLLLAASAWGAQGTAVGQRMPLVVLILLLGLTGWYGTSRMVHNEAIRLLSLDFVRSAEALGAGRRRIALRHLLPNVTGPVLVAASLGVGDVILLETGLSFLGLGVAPPAPSLGTMIFEARSAFATAPWLSIFPGLAIILTVLAVNLVGDALREALDPRST